MFKSSCRPPSIPCVPMPPPSSALEPKGCCRARRVPATALPGPRQCGKTTLAKDIASRRKATYFDLESPADNARLRNPLLMLEAQQGLVVIDEIQQRPELLEVLRVLADRQPPPARFLILGSASPQLVEKSSETLAGRVESVDMGGFDLEEVGVQELQDLWVRGGFPRSFLAAADVDSVAWRENFIRTFLTRDIPQLGLRIPAATLRRFWTMLAHYHGQTWNGSEFARSFGVTDKTVRHYLDILTGTFMARQLPAWFENVKKRQVRAPKVYLTDSGILHSLLRLEDHHQVLGHPKCGASWEGFALEQVIRRYRVRDGYFWSTHGGAELDLYFVARGRPYGFEFKLSETPQVSKSMRTAMRDLRLEHLWLVYPGKKSFPLEEGIGAVPLSGLPATLGELLSSAAS